DHASGEPMLLAATEAGDLFKLDRAGRRLGSACFGTEGIIGMEVIAHPEKKRNDVVLATRSGGVLVCDDDTLLVRASGNLEMPLTGLMLGPEKDGGRMVYAVTARGVNVLGYYPYFLRKMRTD
ncbi:MAG: hypothetical protein ACYC9O_21600, partial [Candidatus Latescibacterota bacterium]